MLCQFNQKVNLIKSKRAFGIVELMVSISIMALVTTVMITRQSAFNGAVLLRNQAYEVAFTLRQAQLLAVNGGDDNVRQYGVHFDTATANQHQYILFKDNNDNGRYDSGEQIGLTGRLDDRFEIRGINIGAQTPSIFSVVFERPNFDAKFYRGATLDNSSLAYINISKTGDSGTDAGDARRVQVTATGQINVLTY